MDGDTEGDPGADREDLGDVGDQDAPVGSAFVLGAVVGVLVLGLVWFSVTLSNEEYIPAETGSSAPDSPGLTLMDAPEQPPVVHRTRLERCVQAEKRLSTSLEAAVPAMRQWQLHVGAMNKLVIGAISLQQATDFWNQTRVAAKRKIGDFEDARRSVRHEGLDCPVAERLGRASRELHACALRVDADEHAVELAGTAVRTWAGHVEDMDMLRMGHLSPSDATQAWLTSWQQGVREIQAYQDAARTARNTGAC